MTIRTSLTGFDLLNDPRLNKGTAFSERERDAFALHGLLPPHLGTLEDQVARRRRAFAEIPTDFGRYRFMRDLQDANETLFYALMQHDIEAMLPIVYTPTVGEGCQRFSEIWHKPRGLFLSYPIRDRIARILAHPRYDTVRCVVVSDGERILGLGDQGAGGMGIPIGKLALYTALGGIPPETCLPVLLDAGTDNAERLRDPLYIGWSHARVRGEAYDELVEAFVAAARARWPQVLLQWEDFAAPNAGRLLDRYRDQLCTFNDDIQGTAAVAAASLMSAEAVTGVPLAGQRVVIFGFGSAGQGIAQQLVRLLRDQGLPDAEARRRIFAIDRQGLLVDGDAGLTPGQRPFARDRQEVAAWWRGDDTARDLASVVRAVRPTALIGVSGRAGAFTADAVHEMARHAERPVILALSNPTSRCEASPQQLLDWTAGRALVGTGSPFPAPLVGGRTVHVDQTNNSYIFPGLALGVVAAKARRVSDGMIGAAAMALARLSPARADPGAALLPPLSQMRAISCAVARAVAERAMAEGFAPAADGSLDDAIAASTWEPVYEDYALLA